MRKWTGFASLALAHLEKLAGHVRSIWVWSWLVEFTVSVCDTGRTLGVWRTPCAIKRAASHGSEASRSRMCTMDLRTRGDSLAAVW